MGDAEVRSELITVPEGMLQIISLLTISSIGKSYFPSYSIPGNGWVFAGLCFFLFYNSR
jgi:hypothetical protein